MGCEWRDKINAELVNQNTILRAQLEFSKALIPTQHKTEPRGEEVEDWQPVGGYKPLRQRIAEAERKAKEENATEIE